MNLLNFIKLLLVIIATFKTTVDCFWLTDGSLFQPATSDIKQLPEASNQANSTSDVIVTNRLQQQQSLNLAELSKAQSESSTSLQQSQAPSQAGGGSGATNVQTCQCNTEWLQANANQWLQTDEFVKYLRQSIASLMPPNTTTSITGTGKRTSSSASVVESRSLAWNKPAQTSKRNGTFANNRPARTNRPAAAAALKLVPGPKGERGPPGERGPSGAEWLISVKDRDALFDLAAASSISPRPEVKRKVDAGEQQQQQQLPQRRLVFVESEQLLAVETALGWRPIQMLAPLRDFRKTIAKFSLQTADQRRRLLEIVSASDDDDDDDDEEEDEEEEVEDDATNNIDRDEDEDDAIDDDDDDDDEDEDEEDDNQIGKAKAAATTSEKPKRRRAQVLGRSAVAAMSSEAADRVMRLRLVALNEPFAGNQRGLRGANFECKRQAARANVRGAFRALLATNYQNLNEIVRHNAHVHKFPIVNLRGETLANSWQELFRSPVRMANPLSRLFSFDGRHVASDPKWPNKLVWHGASNKLGLRDPTHNCDGWHSDSLAKFGFATPLHSPKGHAHAEATKKAARNQQRRFLDELMNEGNSSAPVQGLNSRGSLVFDVIEKYPCRMPLIVLCIETIAQSTE